MHGYGFLRVRVRVGKNLPVGDPCPSLLGIKGNINYVGGGIDYWISGSYFGGCINYIGGEDIGFSVISVCRMG